MMDIKIIKTETEYEQALARIYTLMDATPDSPEEEELELVSLLVEKYEGEHYPIDPPDPVEAILFRMDQEGLTPKDMIKYLGSQSKVSEVLNYKRPLSLTMIRNLHEGLGIPAEVLLQQSDGKVEENPYSWRDYPFAELFKQGYFDGFDGTLLQAKAHAPELLADLFSVFQGRMPKQIYCKQADKEFDSNALRAWQARTLNLALEKELPEYAHKDLTEGFIRQVVGLSYFSQGPLMVGELLNKRGIHFVILPHLPKTYLDGACFYAPDRRPVIGMTLRHDRSDNFWFTLVHELAHLYLHLREGNIAYFDDTERPVEDPGHPEEYQANHFARQMLISNQAWKEVGGYLMQAQDEKPLLEVAEQMLISPAIVAGRVRWECGDYSCFTNLVGYKKVRRLFPNYS